MLWTIKKKYAWLIDGHRFFTTTNVYIVPGIGHTRCSIGNCNFYLPAGVVLLMAIGKYYAGKNQHIGAAAFFIKSIGNDWSSIWIIVHGKTLFQQYSFAYCDVCSYHSYYQCKLDFLLEIIKFIRQKNKCCYLKKIVLRTLLFANNIKSKNLISCYADF